MAVAINKVGVIGSGQMGNGIAQACATVGLPVVMIDINDAAVARGAPGKFIVADMPFLSYRKGLKEAMDCVQALMAGLARAGRSRFDLAFMLTDLGRCDLGPLATGFWFTTVQTAGVEALVVSAAGVADRLELGIAWPRPLLPDGDAEAFANLEALS